MAGGDCTQWRFSPLAVLVAVRKHPVGAEGGERSGDDTLTGGRPQGLSSSPGERAERGHGQAALICPTTQQARYWRDACLS